MLEFVPVRFQSTHPVRGATDSLHEIAAWWKFQSTHPVRGATVTDSVWIYLESFQSTHPVRGATVVIAPATMSPAYFNPRTP